MQPPITTGPAHDATFLGHWTGAKGKPFARIAEQKRGALTRRQRRPSPPRSASHKQEPTSIHGATKRGVSRQWTKVDINVGERDVGVER